jgi:hypothetical protein
MVMTLYMTVVKQHSQHIMTIWYIQSIAELKYTNILYAFHEFTVQKL